MDNTLWLTLNILKVNFRKISTIITFFLLPVCGIFLSLLIYNPSEYSSLRIGVVDEDQTVLSQNFIRSLENEGQFTISTITRNVMTSQISTGFLDCVVIIPTGFGTAIYHEQAPQLNLISIKGETVTAWIKTELQVLVRNLLDFGTVAGGDQAVFRQIYDRYQQNHSTLGVIRVHDRSANKKMTTQSIGFLILLMMVGAGNASELILREKRDRTYYRICMTPVSVRTYLLGNVLANLLIVVVQSLLMLLLMTRVFGMATHIPFIQLLGILTLFGLVAIALGLLIVAFSKDTSQASSLQNLIITPTCMLAGCLWPSDIMPKAIQRISDFLPQRWTISAIQKLQEGSGFNQIWIHIGIIAAFALAFFLIAAYRFNRNDEVKTFI